jgi:hypothetical protein
MGLDLKPWECSLHVIKSSSKDLQKGRGKTATSGPFLTGQGARLRHGHISLVVTRGDLNNHTPGPNACGEIQDNGVTTPVR